LNQKADKAGFIVVYPDGTGVNKTFLFWNAGGITAAAVKLPNDVAFVDKLLDDLSKVVNVDTKRVYATGMSNGAMMAYRLAAELSERIAAVAPVAGTMAVPECKPKRPVPILHFHGTEDTLVPFKGINKNVAALIKFRSVEDSVKSWVKVNGCPDEA